MSDERQVCWVCQHELMQDEYKLVSARGFRHNDKDLCIQYLTEQLAAAEAAARFYAKWYDGPAEALLGEEDRKAFTWIENGGVT